MKCPISREKMGGSPPLLFFLGEGEGGDEFRRGHIIATCPPVWFPSSLMPKNEFDEPRGVSDELVRGSGPHNRYTSSEARCSPRRFRNAPVLPETKIIFRPTRSAKWR